MGDHARDRVTAAADDLFDKYLLPKAALAIILVASFAGTAVSLSLSTGWTLRLGLAKWGYLVALAVLTGGLFWKHAFVRPADVTGDAAAYTDRMFGRFDRIALGATVLLFTVTPVVLRSYAPAAVGGGTRLVAGGVVLAFAMLAGWTAVRHRPAATAYRSPTGLAALAAGVLALTATALLEVRAGGGTGLVAVGVRSLHLLAFAAWLGGAVWNIFAAVPSGQRAPTIPVVRAAGEQLERFRWVVRVVIPTIVLTGLLQAFLEFGTSLVPYTSSLVGAVVLAKLGLVGVLFGIFLTCPMWRACSPIDGVCDLQDLDDAPDAAPASRGVTDD